MLSAGAYSAGHYDVMSALFPIDPTEKILQRAGSLIHLTFCVPKGQPHNSIQGQWQGSWIWLKGGF